MAFTNYSVLPASPMDASFDRRVNTKHEEFVALLKKLVNAYKTNRDCLETSLGSRSAALRRLDREVCHVEAWRKNVFIRRCYDLTYHRGIWLSVCEAIFDAACEMRNPSLAGGLERTMQAPPPISPDFAHRTCYWGSVALLLTNGAQSRSLAASALIKLDEGIRDAAQAHLEIIGYFADLAIGMGASKLLMTFDKTIRSSIAHLAPSPSLEEMNNLVRPLTEVWSRIDADLLSRHFRPGNDLWEYRDNVAFMCDTILEKYTVPGSVYLQLFSSDPKRRVVNLATDHEAVSYNRCCRAIVAAKSLVDSFARDRLSDGGEHADLTVKLTAVSDRLNEQLHLKARPLGKDVSDLPDAWTMQPVYDALNQFDIALDGTAVPNPKAGSTAIGWNLVSQTLRPLLLKAKKSLGLIHGSAIARFSSARYWLLHQNAGAVLAALGDNDISTRKALFEAQLAVLGDVSQRDQYKFLFEKNRLDYHQYVYDQMETRIASALKSNAYCVDFDFTLPEMGFYERQASLIYEPKNVVRTIWLYRFELFRTIQQRAFRNAIPGWYDQLLEAQYLCTLGASVKDLRKSLLELVNWFNGLSERLLTSDEDGTLSDARHCAGYVLYSLWLICLKQRTHESDTKQKAHEALVTLLEVNELKMESLARFTKKAMSVDAVIEKMTPPTTLKEISDMAGKPLRISTVAPLLF